MIVGVCVCVCVDFQELKVAYLIYDLFFTVFLTKMDSALCIFGAVLYQKH